MANQWFRMYSEFATDPKVQMLSESYQRRLMMLFCIRCNGDVTLHDDEIAFQLRVTPEEWAETKAAFIAKKFINKDNSIVNWDKRQYASDSSKERVARHREKVRNADVTTCNVTVTPPEQNRTDTEADTDKKDIIAPLKKSFQKPMDVSDETWKQFVEHRRAKKSVVNEIVLKGFRREADKAGIPLQEAIELSIQRGWVGFQADWMNDKGFKNGKSNAKRSIAEQLSSPAARQWLES